MVSVKFTSVLKRFFPDLKTESLEADTVGNLIIEIDRKYPGIKNYMVDETGHLREHVQIYIGEEPVNKDNQLQEKLSSDDKVLIYQAISGG